MPYVIIAGYPFKNHTGTTTYTFLYIAGKAETLEEAKKLANKEYDQCGGLLLILDLESGKSV